MLGRYWSLSICYCPLLYLDSLTFIAIYPDLLMFSSQGNGLGDLDIEINTQSQKLE